MVRNDILGGLKVALSKGASLQDVMQSFYNAGYKKEEIEEAAKSIQNSQTVKVAQVQNPFQKKEAAVISEHIQYTPKPPMQAQPPKPMTNPASSGVPSKEELMQVFSQQNSSLRPISVQPPIQQTNVKQNVSSYGEKTKIDAFTIILIAILVVLIGILISVFLFKDQLVTFLNGFLD